MSQDASIMAFKVFRSQSNRLLLPLVGMGFFVVFYVIAALLYPGGSWINKEEKGFSILNNYLCDLLDDVAVGGRDNEGHFFARIALGILCVSLIYLWYHLKKMFPRTSLNRTIMWISGQLALITTCFLSSATHDEIVRLAGVLGSVAIITLITELFKNRFYGLALLGWWCIGIFAINYYCYETGRYLHQLPLIQKMTFLSFMIWFSLLDIQLYKTIGMIEKKTVIR